MTVTYIHHVYNAEKVGAFLRLLPMWKGGVFKSIWKDLLLFQAIYAAISIYYRFYLVNHKDTKAAFERVCVYMHRYGDYIPLSFILGFYVTQVINRWWSQFMIIPRMETLCMNLVAYLPGSNMRKTRRLITRWTMLSNILTLRGICSGVAKRFPTNDHLVETKLMTEKEMFKLEKMDKVTEDHDIASWYPIQWAQAELRRARKRQGISSDLLYDKLHESLQQICEKNGTLQDYSWANIPLVYTQLVTIAVHMYFATTLLGSQYLTPARYLDIGGKYVGVGQGTPRSVNLVGYDDSIQDFYVPFFTILQFIFYFGWLKVAENLINPFGEDDEDIDVNYIIDRNFQLGYLMVSNPDESDENEEQEDDTFEDKLPPSSLPYTVCSYKTKARHPIHLTDDIMMAETDDEMMLVQPDADEGGAQRIGGNISLTVPHRRTSFIRTCSKEQYERDHCSSMQSIKRKLSYRVQKRTTLNIPEQDPEQSTSHLLGDFATPGYGSIEH